MPRSSYLLHSTGRWPNLWIAVLDYYLDRATGFRAFFPDDPELAMGKDEFLNLPFVSAGEWDGMKGCCEVAGPLTPQARQLLQVARESDHEIRLWSFELLLQDQPLLRLEDFSVCLVFATEAELGELERLGADISRLEKVELHPRFEPETEVSQMTEQDVEALRTELFRLLKPDREGGEEPQP